MSNPIITKKYHFCASHKYGNADWSEEKNLEVVLLLNPKNDEAIYLLTLLRIKQSDYDGAKDLIEKFELVCISFCNNTLSRVFLFILPNNFSLLAISIRSLSDNIAISSLVNPKSFPPLEINSIASQFTYMLLKLSLNNYI